MVIYKAKRLFRDIIVLLAGRHSARVILLVDLIRVCRLSGYSNMASYFSRRLEKYGVFISSKAEIGRDLRLPHPTSIVIGSGVSVGCSVTIYQSVTLGGRVIGDWKNGNYPEIGDGSVIFAGAVVVGKVKIGTNCVIGANSVVICDIPDNSVAVGAPARIVKTIKVSRERNVEVVSKY